jgi:hypothetical protein
MKRTWMLGAAVLAGALSTVTPQAKAAEFGVYVGVRGPVAYVPPCPGPGYVWEAGYMANGYWMPGRWNFIGVRGGPIVRYGVHRDFRYDRGFDHGHFRR